MSHSAAQPFEENRFSMGWYTRSLTGVLGAPGRFFQDLPEKVPYGQSMGFLFMGGLFYTGASLTTAPHRPILVSGILLLNALLMPLVTAFFNYILLTLFLGKRITFSKLFSFYAYASGVTLLASWIPLFTWITEPWKWILVTIALCRGGGLRWFQAVLMAGLTVSLVTAFFMSLVPVLRG